jgi:DNA phosphorothioation-dependent restriction protein DptG
MHQALDIANAILGGKVGFYPEVLAKLSETPFEDNRKDLEFLLDKYKETEIKRLARRSTGKHAQTDMDTSVNSYKEFLRKLERLCVTLQSSDYEPRIRKKVVDIISCRFLKRGRGHYVLSLDKEMLIFLVALMTREVPKNKNMKLESVYKRFNSYGIHFNRGTRQKIEDYLLKLNILVRKSDSGEAQYVKSIL